MVESETGPPAPPRSEVRQVLRDLVEGRRTPGEVADWATPWIAARHPAVEDEAVWNALTTLSGADIEVEPGDYLHGQEDFETWLEDFEAATRQ